MVSSWLSTHGTTAGLFSACSAHLKESKLFGGFPLGLINPLPALTHQSVLDLNAACRSKRTEAYWLFSS